MCRMGHSYGGAGVSKSARHPIKESDFFALLEKDSSETLSLPSPDESSASPIRLTPEFS